MPADNRKFFKYNIEGEYFDEDSGIIKEIIYYPDTKEITFTFLDGSQKTVELANLVANTELATLLAEIIKSDTLDKELTDEGINLEIPESYKNCYIVTSNDISDITPISVGTYAITLSEEIASVITAFKQNLYVDWETEFPEVVGTLQPVKLTNCYPSKKFQMAGELKIHYVFSATDGASDFTMNFYYEDDTWKVTFTMGNLITQEDVSMRISEAVEPLETEIAEKSKVVPNPTLSGDEPDLEGAEIDGIKYKVGGSEKLYQHSIKMIGTGATTGDRLVILNILSYSNQPKTWDNIKTYCTNLQQATGWILASGVNHSIHSVKTQENANRMFVYYDNDLYAFMPEPTSLTDTITEVE